MTDAVQTEGHDHVSHVNKHGAFTWIVTKHDFFVIMDDSEQIVPMCVIQKHSNLNLKFHWKLQMMKCHDCTNSPNCSNESVTHIAQFPVTKHVRLSWIARLQLKAKEIFVFNWFPSVNETVACRELHWRSDFFSDRFGIGMTPGNSKLVTHNPLVMQEVGTCE